MTAEPKNPDADVPDEDEGVPKKPVPDIQPPDFDELARLRQSRKDRLARIKAEIDAGTYDSDELLDAALGRMLHNINMDDDEDDVADEEES